MPALKAQHAPGTAALLGAGCGTAVASVCAIGLFQIERTLGGIWSALAVLLAALSCSVLARALGRLAGVVPSGAGILAYLARGCGRRAGVLIALPYVLLSLFLVGVEAVIVGVLVARYSPLPAAGGALAFLLGTWAFCSSGVRAGYRTQALATWALIGTLAVASIAALLHAADGGELALHLLPPAPRPGDLIAGVGQALFLFMGFELVTSHAEVASHAGAVPRALALSVLVLGAFYTLVSLGFSCASVDSADPAYRFAPQLAMAEHSLGPTGVWLVVALTVLASFTSWNGGLLALSRFTAALASQGMLPRGLARLDARTLVPRSALTALLGLGIASAAIVAWFGALEASILAAAASAALVYAAVIWARERAPFVEHPRSASARVFSYALALAFTALAVAVVLDAGAARSGVLVLLGAAFLTAWLASRRLQPRAAARWALDREVARAD
jgi:amino acid transporter